MQLDSDIAEALEKKDYEKAAEVYQAARKLHESKPWDEWVARRVI